MNLTPRELEVVRLFALGHSWEQVIAETGTARSTIHKHRHAALSKADTDTMSGVWTALGWLRVPRASDSDASPSVKADGSSKCPDDSVAVTPTPSLRRVA